MFIPSEEQRISSGNEFDLEGDYSIGGIERANRDRPDIMTAGALAFWKKHTADRPTIAYAVSVDHAHNLAAVFNDAGIPAAVILGDTKREERDAAIAGFRDGSIKVLVNVAVATEGFDLPDASCIIIARPTMSLALYLQMVGRGLRPKPDGGNCLILDLAANSVSHGLPDDYREWSLEPRGTQKVGEAPVVVCPLCETASPAASHNCRGCGFSFGKDCDRCGRWRSRKRWLYEKHCGTAHQLVCDLCHIDAHIQAHLPVMPPLDELIDLCDPEDEMTFPSDAEIDDDLANRLSALFQELLEGERQSVAGADDARREELFRSIERYESALNDESELDGLFDAHIEAMPESERPQGRVQESRAFADWEGDLRSELAGWKNELAELENQPVDKRTIFNSARNKIMHLLQREAQDHDLLPSASDDEEQWRRYISDVFGQNEDKWCNLMELGDTVPVLGQRPLSMRCPDGTEKTVRSWRVFYTAVIEWLEDAGHLSRDSIPAAISNILHDHAGESSRALKSGKFVNVNLNASAIVGNSRRFIEACREDPSQFHVQLR